VWTINERRPAAALQLRHTLCPAQTMHSAESSLFGTEPLCSLNGPVLGIFDVEAPCACGGAVVERDASISHVP
jgi:hypothetical protein